MYILKLQTTDWGKIHRFIAGETAISKKTIITGRGNHFVLYGKYNLHKESDWWSITVDGNHHRFSKSAVALAWAILHKGGRIDLAQRIEYTDAQSAIYEAEILFINNSHSIVAEEKLSRAIQEKCRNARETTKYIRLAKYWQNKGLIQ